MGVLTCYIILFHSVIDIIKFELKLNSTLFLVVFFIIKYLLKFDKII